ncbi:MAG: HAD family hydrolase [Bacteroidales bacterium]|jgi:D-glycero-D-manno-heptose 1,7-bisphosphate phosphatase|nr:HAD family hydrolase [Bacteroidales bacterium]
MVQKAVFLDRDGVINDGSLYYTYTIPDFRINDGVIEGLQLLQENDFILIIITNQSGVAKGIYSLCDVQKVHEYMIQEFHKHDISIAEIYMCPHHPDVFDCDCRKPKTELFEKAVQDLSVDVSRSYMIGDSERDIIAGNKMGLQSLLIEKNENIFPYCQAIVQNKV